MLMITYMKDNEYFEKPIKIKSIQDGKELIAKYESEGCTEVVIEDPVLAMSNDIIRANKQLIDDIFSVYNDLDDPIKKRDLREEAEVLKQEIDILSEVIANMENAIDD